MSKVYEIEVPQLVLTSTVNNSTENGKGEIVLDWSSYDVTDKYFVIYRKELESNDFETLVSLEQKLTGGKYVDVVGVDKNIPNSPEINIKKNEDGNDIQITSNATDNGSKYVYYVEAYDATNTNVLLSKSEEK